eukprot:TRINITY_DN10169_c0_g1_i1.p1 TRINITY_DN10169_c0_g1~~TRINITY_DN10169_c0_g1_i1.p1  ORF type:complete len:417 (-),score=84.47 TRINITY_DN10169_c0_g1_i1:2-1252(-)
MSILIKNDTIKVIAEINNIDHLSNDVADLLASDVEFRLREIITESLNYMKQSKRETVSSSDINNAMNLKNYDTLYGHSYNDGIDFLNVGNGTYIVDDPDIKLQEFVSTIWPQNCPNEKYMQIHWLSLDGKPMDENYAISPEVAVKEKKYERLFNIIVNSIRDGDANEFESVMFISKTHASIDVILPNLCKFISKEVVDNMEKLYVLNRIIGLIHALILNEEIRIDPYINQLIPVILTCTIGEKICEDPSEDDHWSLRDQSAILLSIIYNRYGILYKDIKKKMTATLINIFNNPTKSMASQYGALKGISELGIQNIEQLIIPSMTFYVSYFKSYMDKGDECGIKCYELLKEIACNFLIHLDSILKETKDLSVHRNILDYPDTGTVLAMQENTTKDYYLEFKNLFGDIFPYLEAKIKT